MVQVISKKSKTRDSHKPEKKTEIQKVKKCLNTTVLRNFLLIGIINSAICRFYILSFEAFYYGFT